MSEVASTAVANRNAPSPQDDLSESYRQSMELSPDGIFVELDKRIVYTNSAIVHLFGAVRSEEILNRSPFDFLHPTSHALVRSRIEALLSGGGIQPLAMEKWVRLDGSIIEAEVVSGLVTWKGENAIQVALRDVTERNRFLAEARAREAQLQSILATVPDGMVMIDENGCIESFSATAERLFGYSADEVNGRNVSILMPSPHREQHDSHIARYLATGERRIIGVGRVVIGQRKDGTMFPIELAVGEAKIEGRRLFTGFVRDLTERQERERRLHELQSELIHLSRLSELGQMVSALAHEVSQPLTAIKNYLRASERLIEGGDWEKASQVNVKAVEQAERAVDIIRRLRELVRKGESHRQAENLRKLIEESAALSLVGAEASGINVDLDVAPDASIVYIDKIQIQQVLLNLLRNALEAMAGSPRRRLMIAARSVGENAVKISVADTGPGLPGDVRDRLFQPFVTTKQNGLGVGLSICRSIVESHGGQISAEINPGGGTIFHFTVPGVSKPAGG